MKVRALSVFAGKKQLMGPVDFELKPGSTLVIMGETGAGKSLIAQALIGTLPTKLWTEGEITINGQRVDQLSKAKRSELWGREISIFGWLQNAPSARACTHGIATTILCTRVCVRALCASR